MRSPHLQLVSPLGADGAALTRVLRQAGVTRDSDIRVTGPAGVTAVLWLCRHGYERAAYIHPHWIGVTGVADALLIPHACTTDELAELLQGGNCLRESGVVIVQASPGRFTEGCRSISDTLEPLDFTVDDHISDRGRDIFVAHRRGFRGFKQAA